MSSAPMRLAEAGTDRPRARIAAIALIWVTTALGVLAGCGGASAPDMNPPNDSAAGAGDSAAPPTDAAPPVGDAAPDSGGDPLVTSFVFVGCNRVLTPDWDPMVNPSSANLPQLKQTFADIAALPARPRFLFFTGDLVLGLEHDTSHLASQLAGWSTQWAAGPLAAILTLLPLPGNHELLYTDPMNVQLSNGDADKVWTDWLTVSGFAGRAGNGPTNAGKNDDALQNDQSKLTYSFDDSGVHYVLLNTDTWTTTPDPKNGSTKIGWIALQWLKADLAAAQANPKVSSVFVFGHKPITNPTGGTGGNNQIDADLGTAMAGLLDATPKVKGYLCSHAHLWDARQLPGARGVYQVVAGNGGTALEKIAQPPVFGFSETRIYASGRVDIVSWQRPVPSPYTAMNATAATEAPALTIAR